jgi:hypothetical protein
MQPETIMHVVPVGDLIRHDVDGELCVCGPDTEWVIGYVGAGKMITHHSLDGRELQLADE